VHKLVNEFKAGCATSTCHVVTSIILGLATGLARSFKHMH
jgi:hypothetical protein